MSSDPTIEEGRLMAHIVIMGAGIGGMPMAYDMRKRARRQDGDECTAVVGRAACVRDGPGVAGCQPARLLD